MRHLYGACCPITPGLSRVIWSSWQLLQMLLPASCRGVHCNLVCRYCARWITYGYPLVSKLNLRALLSDDSEDEHEQPPFKRHRVMMLPTH